MITLTWQQYAEFLMSTNGIDAQDAVEKARKVYKKQYDRDISEENIKQFHDALTRPWEIWEIEELIDRENMKKCH